MSDSPTWSQRKSWNNDGMDPDWRPNSSQQEVVANKQECPRCGMDLYKALVKAWPDQNLKFSSLTLPEYPSINKVTIPLDDLKRFNAGYKEISEFAAWVCGTTVDKLNRLDMMNYIKKKQQESRG